MNRAVDLLSTILSLGTNRILRRWIGGLRAHGLIGCALPVLLINEGFGAYRIYLSGAAAGWW